MYDTAYCTSPRQRIPQQDTSVTNSEQIKLLDRCLYNRSEDSTCAYRFSGDKSSPSSLSLMEAVQLCEQFGLGRGNVGGGDLNGSSSPFALSSSPFASSCSPFASSSSPLGERRLLGDIEQAIGLVKLLAETQPCPILAISGLLNAGKTSLVAGFLSDEGQSRLLIGSSNHQGTHRFILWLPETWRKRDELWANAMQQLHAVFGVEPEELASEPRLAFRQYNGECFLQSLPQTISPINIPLVATDPALDRWGIGLMDCPDIQTGITENLTYHTSVGQSVTEEIESIAESRSKMLVQALKIASAFVVVTSANSIQDESVSNILNAAGQAKPGLKRILAVNRVPRRYLTSEIAQEIREGYREFGLWGVYMAYHFEGPLDRSRMAKFPDSTNEAPSELQRPVFFRIDNDPPVQPPTEVPIADFLISLGSQLDRNQLVREMLQSTLITLKHHCRQALSIVETYAKESERRVRRLHRTFSEAALTLSMADGNTNSNPSIRLQVSREIVGQIAESLERTAPWWALPSRRLMRWSDQLRKMAGGVTQWVAVPSWISDRASAASHWVRSRWRSGEGGRIISASSYGEAIRNCDLSGDLIDTTDTIIPQQTLQQIEAIIERFQAESRTRLRDQQLDAYTRETWQRMSWKQRLWTGIAPAGLLFAPLLAVVMVPLDFGGTAVLVCASMKELLFAGMASVGMAMINSDHMPQIAEQEAAWQQISELFAITCDAFSIPRPQLSEYPELTYGQSTKKIVESTLPVRIPQQSSPQKPLIELHPSFPRQLDEILSGFPSNSSN